MRATKSGKVARDARIPQRAARLAAVRGDLVGPVPLADQPAVDRVGRRIVEQRRELVQLVAGQATPAAGTARQPNSRFQASRRQRAHRGGQRPVQPARHRARGARQTAGPEIAVVAARTARRRRRRTAPRSRAAASAPRRGRSGSANCRRTARRTTRRAAGSGRARAAARHRTRCARCPDAPPRPWRSVASS